jgi:hypothetical protein
MMKRISVFFLAALLWTNTTLANDEALQSFETCSLITSEYLTVLQLASRGFEQEALKDNLPGISDRARNRVDALYEMIRQDGLTETYSTIHSEYARCARKVYQRTGLPPQGTREAHFHFCAGENKVRYEIAMAAFVNAPLEEVRRQLHPQHQQVAETIYKMHGEEGVTAVLDSLASELKFCINNDL